MAEIEVLSCQLDCCSSKPPQTKMRHSLASVLWDEPNVWEDMTIKTTSLTITITTTSNNNYNNGKNLNFCWTIISMCEIQNNQCLKCNCFAPIEAKLTYVHSIFWLVCEVCAYHLYFEFIIWTHHYCNCTSRSLLLQRQLFVSWDVIVFVPVGS